MTSHDSRQLVAQWLVTHRPAMLSLAGLFADAVHGREDIVSRARVVALQRHAQATGVENPLGWLLTITKSVGLQVARKRDRRAKLRRAGAGAGLFVVESSDAAVAQEWQSAQFGDDRREQVLEIAQGLTPALQELVHHVLLDNWDDDEIADFYGITHAAVRRRRKRAASAIRRALPPPPPGVLTPDARISLILLAKTRSGCVCRSMLTSRNHPSMSYFHGLRMC